MGDSNDANIRPNGPITVMESYQKAEDNPNKTNANLDMGISTIENPKTVLRNLKANNRDRIIIGAININTLGGKFEPLVSIVKDKLNIIMISETKIDASYPKSQFNIEGYSEPYRKDRNCNGGGIILYLRDDIPRKLLNI